MLGVSFVLKVSNIPVPIIIMTHNEFSIPKESVIT